MNSYPSWLREAASRGGKATGAIKRRGDAAHYRRMSRKAAKARKAKSANDPRCHSAPTAAVERKGTMGKSKKPKRKKGAAVLVKRMVSRLEDAYHQTIETRNASRLFSKLWEYYDGLADGIAFAIQELKSADDPSSPTRPGEASP